MQFQHPARAGPLVQAIHVLGDDDQRLDHGLEFDQGPVAGMRLCRHDTFAPVLVPAPDLAGIPRKGPGRGQVFGPELRPDTGLSVTECGDATPQAQG